MFRRRPGSSSIVPTVSLPHLKQSRRHVDTIRLVDAAQRKKTVNWLDGYMSNRAISEEAMMPVEPTQLVDDVMRRWPKTIRVFLNHRMHCVGCPIACFHTVADACREHGVDQAQFVADLNAMIEQGSIPATRDVSAPIIARWPA